jgi:O-antigen ligase/tetratricopeptide (TPR) repeat protein
MPFSNILENISVRAIKIIVYLILFLPFVVTPSLTFPYVTGKNFAFRLLVELASVFWICLLFLNSKYRLRFSSMLSVVIMFAAIVGLADFTGISRYISFWSNYERMEGYITIIHLVLYFMVLKSTLKTRKDWGRYVNVFLAVGLLVSLESLFISPPAVPDWPYSGSYVNRIYGTLGNPPFLASYMLLCAYVAFIAVSFTRKISLKAVYMLLSVVNFTVIYFTATRGAILAGLLGLFMICILQIITRNISIKKKVIKYAVVYPLVVFLVIFSLGFLILSNTDLARHDRVLSRFVTMFSDLSVQSRIHVWKMAWEGVKERPILGWGQENFIAIYTRNTISSYSRPSWMDRAHNVIIDWLVNAGALGLLSYLAIFGTTFYVLWKKHREKDISTGSLITIMTTLTVYFIHNLFTFDTISTYTVFFALLAFIDSDAFTKNTMQSVSDNAALSKKMTGKPLIAAGVSILLFAYSYYSITYKPLKQMRSYQRIITSISKYRSLSLLMNDFEKALSYGTFGDRYVIDGMIGVASYIVTKKQFRNRNDTARFVEITVEKLRGEIKEYRYDLEYLTHAIDFYWLLSEINPSYIESTIKLIEQCIRINPEYHDLYVTLADVYLLKNDYGKAFAAVNTISGKERDNDALQFKLSLLAILNSKEDIAENALSQVKKIRMRSAGQDSGKTSVLSADELMKLASAYMNVKNYHRALQSYEQSLGHVSVSNDRFRQAQIHLAIAKTYITLGDRENALNEAGRSQEILESISDKADKSVQKRKARLKSKIAEFYNSIDADEHGTGQ